VYLALAYVIVPALWSHYADRHPSVDDIPPITHTSNHIPGDPINVGLIGTQLQVVHIMRSAGWRQADDLSLRSGLGIAAASVMQTSYEQAPVSSLYLFGRMQDLAFEKCVGRTTKQRHHVRFWLTEKVDADDRPLWVGAATFDRSVGLSHRTGQVTHHIEADVDRERDRLLCDLDGTEYLAETYAIRQFHKVLQGRNGGGDAWRTDGALHVAVIDSEK
jgi:hypothetical protein